VKLYFKKKESIFGGIRAKAPEKSIQKRESEMLSLSDIAQASNY